MVHWGGRRGGSRRGRRCSSSESLLFLAMLVMQCVGHSHVSSTRVGAAASEHAPALAAACSAVCEDRLV